jgi:hypothetical protein
MRKRLPFTLVVLLCFATIAGPAQAKEKSAKKKRERYTATAMVAAGAFGGSVFNVNINIDEYTTAEERLELAQALVEGGSDALREKLDKMKKGRVSVPGRTGNELNYAWIWPMENGRRIMMATVRPMTFFELRRGFRSRDYEFGVIELEVDARGRGTGWMIVAAQIKFIEEEKKIELEHYGIEPVRLTNVRLWD